MKMKKINYLLPVILSLIIFSTGCKTSSKSGFNIKGTVEGARNKPVYFEKTSFNSVNETIKEVKADKGSFNINVAQNPGPGLYKVRIGRNSVLLILEGNENNIDIQGKYTKFNNSYADVSGSKLTEKYNNVLKDLKARKIDIMSIKEEAKKSNPLLGSILLFSTYGTKPSFADLHAAVSKKMKEQYPDNYLTKEYEGIVSNLQKSYQREQARQKIKVGEPAPEIAMPGVDGKIRKLSDLKGKIVLIDFWASWCGPCVRSFPELTKIYNKYKDKGFTVFSVSLDGIDQRTAQRRYPNAEALKKAKENSKTRWIKAIEKHGLVWENHVSDLDKWDCKAAALYGVRSIPRTFLVDKNGVIAAVNPRFNLEEAIQKVLEKE